MSGTAHAEDRLIALTLAIEGRWSRHNALLCHQRARSASMVVQVATRWCPSSAPGRWFAAPVVCAPTPQVSNPHEFER